MTLPSLPRTLESQIANKRTGCTGYKIRGDRTNNNSTHPSLIYRTIRNEAKMPSFFKYQIVDAFTSKPFSGNPAGQYRYSQNLLSLFCTEEDARSQLLSFRTEMKRQKSSAMLKCSTLPSESQSQQCVDRKSLLTTLDVFPLVQRNELVGNGIHHTNGRIRRIRPTLVHSWCRGRPLRTRNRRSHRRPLLAPQVQLGGEIPVPNPVRRIGHQEDPHVRRFCGFRIGLPGNRT
jgi:hypothetical protein